MKKDFYLKNTEFVGLSFFGISHNFKAKKYGEYEKFIAIQLKKSNGEIVTTDIILNEDKSVKSILTELNIYYCEELLKWIVEWFYTPTKAMATVVTIDNVEFLSNDGARIEGIFSNNLSKKDIEKILLELLKKGNFGL